MSESLFSSSWYRVADLKPRLRGHVQVHRHSYRDDVWFVVQDHLSGKFHRFSEGANYVIGLMDGKRTVDQIWQLAAEELGDDSPTQEEMIRLLSQLHSAEVLQSEVPPDSRELFERQQRMERAKLKQKFWSPLAIRFKLFDPERFLVRGLPFVKPLFSYFGFILWLLVVLSGLVLAAMHWSQITESVADKVLAPQNLLILWLVYPVVKSIHELGHAFATKVWGGEVHEIGIMLLVFMPVPFVDASAASAFKEKRRRVIVGAIGIMVEMFLAAIALIVWLNAEYGLVRSIAYNVMLIGGVSTLFFNGNPLLRFDGYYVLSDAVEIPNLAKKSQTYLGYLAQRYLFNVKKAEAPSTSHGEKRWLVFYGVASFVYRMFIAVAIILFVAGQFFVIGVMLAVWAAFTMLVVPMFKSLKFIFTSPKLEQHRPRVIVITAAIMSFIAFLLFVVPAPNKTMAEGVVWLPEKASVRAGTDCFLRELKARTGDIVNAGEVLVICEDSLLSSRKRVAEGRLDELNALLVAQRNSDDRVAVRITKEEIKSVKGELSDITQRMSALLIRSPLSGKLVLPGAENLPDQFINQGHTLGHVVENKPMSVRVAVKEHDVALVRGQTQAVDLQLADRMGLSISAEIVRQVPGGTDILPSPVLGKEGGGEFDVDPRDGNNTRTFFRVFEYDLALPDSLERAPVGTRAFVRFDHGFEPIGFQWYRSARQVFLSHFGA